MSMLSHRLRRALSIVSSSLSGSTSLVPTSVAPRSDIAFTLAALPKWFKAERPSEFGKSQERLFSTRQYKLYKEGDEITPDTVLFEGCDYNHWLITMDFPKDNPPPPEEMVATYEKTCAQGLGISVEEAKKRMYACSTTTYQGFQAIMTEEESEKFRDVPGVVFILPDSYIDPVNKEYGGDKYENGVITPRPPPVQYGRSRPRDNNRNRVDRQGDQNFQRNAQFGPQQPMRGDGRGFSPPQQNYGPPGQAQRGQMPPHQGSYNQGQGAPYQGNYNQGAPGNFRQGPPPGNFNQGPQGNFAQAPPGNFNQGPQNYYNQPNGGNFNQRGPQNYYPQNGGGNYASPQAGNHPGYGQSQSFQQGDQRNNNPNSVGTNFPRE